MEDAKITQKNEPMSQKSARQPASRKLVTSRRAAKKLLSSVSNDEPKVINTLRKLTSGVISGKMLTPTDRRACLALLLLEGKTVPELAQLFGRSERTIERDKKEIRRRNALEFSLDLTSEIAGELTAQYEVCIGKLRRAASSKDAKPKDRIEAERNVWLVLEGYAKILHKLGYLETPGDVFLARAWNSHNVSQKSPAH